MNKLLPLFCLILLIYSCKAPLLQSNNHQNYPPTIFPTDTTQLWATDGTINSDTVLLICQGGPAQELTFLEKGRTSYRYIPNYSNYHIAYVHQAQTLNNKMFRYKKDFNIEMANKEVDNSSEILYRSLQYFKSRGKTTIVIGNSYGAYLIPNYLSTRPSLADKYIILAGRIDDNQAMLEQHLKGFNGSFAADGLSYIAEDENADLSKYSKKELKAYRVRQLLKGAIGSPRYSEKLAQHDLSNIIYFYASNDQHVGRLSSSEIDFLQAKGAKVFETHDGHSEVLYRFIDMLMDGSLQL